MMIGWRPSFCYVEPPTLESPPSQMIRPAWTHPKSGKARGGGLIVWLRQSHPIIALSRVSQRRIRASVLPREFDDAGQKEKSKKTPQTHYDATACDPRCLVPKGATDV